jgi:hypothetical protein
MTFTLSDKEHTDLLIMLGFATAMAWKDTDKSLAYSFIRLANAINANNPNWKPYEVPERSNV